EFMQKIAGAAVRIAGLSVAAILLSYWIGGAVLALVFGDEYSTYVDELAAVVVVGSMLSFFSITNLMLSAQRSFNVQLPIYILIALVVFIASHELVSAYGMIGGMYAQGVGYI